LNVGSPRCWRRFGRAGFGLPGGSGWLIRRCGWQAAGCGSQLRQLLAEPEMAALLLAAPQAGRLFRPLCRMLAVELPPELARERGGAKGRHRPTPPKRGRALRATDGGR
jgi:hypothetical protein